MGTLTITGCVKTDTGTNNTQIVFDSFPCSDGQLVDCVPSPIIKPIGCIVNSGEHKGMVAITLNKPNCPDTYYGCLNADNKFEIIIPDDCCYALYTCGWCSPYPTPYQIVVTFSGIEIDLVHGECVRITGSYSKKYLLNYIPNSTFILTQDPSYYNNWFHSCYWACPNPTPKVIMTEHNNSDCSGAPCYPETPLTVRIEVAHDNPGFVVNQQIGDFNGVSAFAGLRTTTLEGDYNNNYGGIGEPIIGRNGVAHISL